MGCVPASGPASSESASVQPAGGSSALASVQPLEWQVAKGFPDPVDSYVQDVVAGGPGFIAVGHFFTRQAPNNDREQGAIWTSIDGGTWQRLKNDPAFDGADIRAITRSDEGLLAIGFVANPTEVGTAVWTSADGLTWQRHLDAIRPFGSVADVAWGPSRYVAVGSVTSADPQGGPTQASIWVSADGGQWTQLDTVPEGLSMESVYSVGIGFLAIARMNDEIGNPAIWRSLDGIHWQAVARFPRGAGSPRAITAGGGRLVGVGSADAAGGKRLIGATWVSADGRDWKRTRNQTSLDDAFLEAVVPTTLGFVALGTLTRPGAPDVPSSWISLDGREWTRGPDLGDTGEIFVDAAATSDRLIVAVGNEAANPPTPQEEGGARVWFSRLP